MANDRIVNVRIAIATSLKNLIPIFESRCQYDLQCNVESKDTHAGLNSAWLDDYRTVVTTLVLDKDKDVQYLGKLIQQTVNKM